MFAGVSSHAVKTVSNSRALALLLDAHIYTCSLGGGTIRYCNQLVAGLSARGVNVTLLIPQDSRPRRGVQLPDCPVVHGVENAGAFDILHVPYCSDIPIVSGARTCLLYTSPSPRD